MARSSALAASAAVPSIADEHEQARQPEVRQQHRERQRGERLDEVQPAEAAAALEEFDGGTSAGAISAGSRAPATNSPATASAAWVWS